MNILKLCTTAYQTLSPGNLSYLFSLLSLAPSGFHLLIVPSFKTHADNRAFSVILIIVVLTS